MERGTSAAGWGTPAVDWGAAAGRGPGSVVDIATKGTARSGEGRQPPGQPRPAR
ncbi:hypothetical protein GCM10010972_07680 [Cellulomonas carbonis]|nr:hypothetical protein GCM10010972_07680 [Cellulomonas carbonis]